MVKPDQKKSPVHREEEPDTVTMTMAATTPFPESIEAAWLSELLARNGHRWDVVSVRMDRVGTGQLGDTFRITPGYGARTGPATLIGKFAASNPESREAAAGNGLYAREIGFYRELAAHARLSTARCFAAELARDGTFALLLEDCSPAQPGDQIAGISAAQARAAVIEAARLHAAFWNATHERDLSWLESGEAGMRPLTQPFYPAEAIQGAWPAYKERHAADLTPETIAVCDRFCARYEAYAAIDPARPRCVTHNDFRPDNMLFDGEDRLKVVDWQSAALGYAAVDVAYLIGGAFQPEVRRLHEQALVNAYYDELLAQGVADYSRAQFEEDYRRFSFAGINVAVCAAMSVMRTERGDRLFLTMLDRHVQHVLDTGALRLLD